MRRIVVLLTGVCIAIGVQVAAGPSASAGCQGPQHNAYPCNPNVPCFDDDGDGDLDCLSAADAFVDAVLP